MISVKPQQPLPYPIGKYGYPGEDTIYVVLSYRGEHGICCFDTAFRYEDDAVKYATDKQADDDAKDNEALWEVYEVHTGIGFEN